MIASIGTAVLMGGMLLAALSQLLIGLHAFTGSPLQGLFCFLVPMYIWAYARRHKVGRKLIAAWYTGIGLMVLGTVLLS